jgi:hypothetical protein
MTTLKVVSQDRQQNKIVNGWRFNFVPEFSRELREKICNSASDWSIWKTVKKIKIFFFVLLTDQSEAELLYFYSLFFSVKKPFQKTK